MIVFVVLISTVVIGTLVFVTKKPEDSLRPMKIKADNNLQK